MAQPLEEVPFTEVTLRDDFWSKRLETNRNVTLWHNIEMCEKTGRVANFLRAAGKQQGTHEGFVFNDSDLYKVIEAASYSLMTHPDPKLEAKLDEWIAIIAAAQQPDGYLNTYYTLKAPDKRLTNLKDNHEFYCAGHLIEGAVAHHQATRKRSLLDIAIKFADFIDQRFGEGKRHDVDGHEEIELALFKLADATGQGKYRKLGEFFVRERGQSRAGRKPYGPYHQDTIPVVQYESVIGHAVRQMYLACAMTDMALTGHDDMRPALARMWSDMTTGKLYITGGVGARHDGEAFGEAFELPNESAYAETCAGIGSALWNHRMNLLTGESKHADEVERVSYNGFLSGVSVSGDKYFYVNPLASRGNHHRTPWFPCACCPPNVARYMATVPGRAYATKGDELVVNLYAAGEAKITLPKGKVKLSQQTRYPWDGQVKVTIEGDTVAIAALRFRTPGWCENPSIAVNGSAREMTRHSGYALIPGPFQPTDIIELNLPMPIKRIKSDPRVKDNIGRVAIQRGPIVYCAEAVDNNGHVTNLILPPDAQLKAEHRDDLLGGVTVITGKAMAKTSADAAPTQASFTAIPYYAWDHREPGEMAVWLAEDPSAAKVPPAPSIASKSRASASHVGGNGILTALNDQEALTDSRTGPHFAWWPRKGTSEWIQYDFAQGEKVGAVEIYWFDDVPGGGCKAPASWTLLYKESDAWKPVELTKGGYATDKDKLHRVEFKPITTTAMRVEVKLQDGFSGGVMEWRVHPAND